VTCTMANPYYQQQPQYFKPQNIYDQLKNQDPQRVPVQLQHLLGQQQPTPSLVQQRIQSFQQPVQIVRPPTVYPQPGPLVPYHPGPLVPYHPYHPVYTPAPPPPQPPLVHSTPSALQPTHRRPLPPDPAKRSRSEPQPLTPTRSQSPTRSRPLPSTTPAAPRLQSNVQPPTNIQHPPSLRPRTPSPTKSNPLPQPPPSLRPRTPSPTKSNPLPQPPTANVNVNVHAEPPRRGRASPPKFSTVPISASSLSSHTTNSPSPGSSPSPSPTRQSVARKLPQTASAPSGTQPFNAPFVTLPKSQPDPAPSPPKPKPVWKKTLPDVLPPLLPTPPPNPIQQPQPPRQPHNSSFNQPVPPPPVPSHSRPPYKPTFVPRHPVTPDTNIKLWSKPQPAPKPPQPDDENEDEEEEDGDNESQYTYEYFYSDEDEPIPKPLDPRVITPSPQASPQYGIRDLPPRTASAFPHPEPLPRPPPMVRGNGVFPPDSDSRTVQNPSNSSRPTNAKAGTWDTGDPRKEKSMTMRFAAGRPSHRESSRTDVQFSPDVWPGENRPKLFQADGSGEMSSRFDAVNLDDTSPPRSVFSMRQNGADTPPSPQRRELPRPQPRALGNAVSNVGQQKQRPHSQIYSGRVSEQQNVVKDSRRPQSQIYDQPLQRQQVFARESREHPQQQDGYVNRHPQQSPIRQSESPPGQQHYSPSSSPTRQRSQPTRQQPLYQHHDQQTRRNQQQSRTAHIRSPSPAIPPISISIIESPAPIGGRAKLADIEKMESEGSASPTCSPSMPIITILDDDEPPRRSSGSAPQIHIDGLPSISVQGTSENYGGRGSIPQINVSGIDRGGGGRREQQQQGRGPQINVFEVPGVSASGPYDVPNGGDVRRPGHSQSRVVNGTGSSGIHHPPARRGGLVCGGCGGPIVGRIVNAMGQRWHPGCFRCTVCDELLEHVSSYESGGKAYCHLDYHEVCRGFLSLNSSLRADLLLCLQNFAPKCYHCKTSIVEERFISLDDPALGKRTYHEQHFFCAECGDPFLTPTIGEPGRTGEFSSCSLNQFDWLTLHFLGELSVTCDGEYAASDDVGFTVYRGHPYCEACHVRLRMPKCKKCKRSIRDGDKAVEALGGKWCWKCFVCKVGPFSLLLFFHVFFFWKT